MDSVRYDLALLGLILMPGALLYWFSIHPFVRFWRGLGARIAVTLHIVMIAAVGYGMYLLRGRLLAVEYGTNPLLVAISVPLLIGSFVLRWALGRQMKLRILMGVPELTAEAPSQRLLCEGIYARIRHPRYLEIFLALVFYALFTNYLVAYAIAAASVPTLLAIIHIEERELRDRFGEEYVRYCARVPRFWPWWPGFTMDRKTAP
jgi:protein-S-isoprenylcysteine O-methyltransferase Ste14